eukprot:5421654-Pleurochrysis_carterae.AAC.1
MHAAGRAVVATRSVSGSVTSVLASVKLETGLVIRRAHSQRELDFCMCPLQFFQKQLRRALGFVFAWPFRRSAAPASSSLMLCGCRAHRSLFRRFATLQRTLDCSSQCASCPAPREGLHPLAHRACTRTRAWAAARQDVF